MKSPIQNLKAEASRKRGWTLAVGSMVVVLALATVDVVAAGCNENDKCCATKSSSSAASDPCVVYSAVWQGNVSGKCTATCRTKETCYFDWLITAVVVGSPECPETICIGKETFYYDPLLGFVSASSGFPQLTCAPEAIASDGPDFLACGVGQALSLIYNGNTLVTLQMNCWPCDHPPSGGC
jgi:hypothetical protein